MVNHGFLCFDNRSACYRGTTAYSFLGIVNLLKIKLAGVNVIQLRSSVLRTFSPYFRKRENKSLDKIRKYGENIRKTEIRSFITLTPEWINKNVL